MASLPSPAAQPSRLEPLGEAWRGVFVEELGDVDTGVGSAVVQLTVTDDPASIATFQVFEDGRLAEWSQRGHADPDVVLLLPRAAMARFASGTADADDLEAARITTGGSVDMRSWAVPPLDEQGVHATGRFAVVPDAHAMVEMAVHESPFGPFTYAVEFREGRQMSLRLGPAPEAAVSLPLTFEGLLRHRLGQVALAEALAEGEQGRGEWPELMLTAGLLDRPEYVDAVRTAAPPARALEALAILAEIMTSPNYAAALARARARLT